jgi:hypothetical protein
VDGNRVSWDRQKAAHALAELLAAAVPEAAVFETPPAGFNPPALIVQYPSIVTLSSPSFGTDVAAWVVLCAVGPGEPGPLDELLADATAAVRLDPTLGRVTQSTRPVEWRNWRLLSVTGAEYLAADLALETRM